MVGTRTKAYAVETESGSTKKAKCVKTSVKNVINLVVNDLLVDHHKTMVFGANYGGGNTYPTQNVSSVNLHVEGFVTEENMLTAFYSMGREKAPSLTMDNIQSKVSVYIL